ncbi:MAG: hypothetical protein ACOYYJ_08790 [Chloroflexota bacterium]
MIHVNNISRTTAQKFAIFIIFVAYLSIGFFPSAPIEGDGNGIANGAALMAVDGFGANDLSYRYEVQTGSYVLIVWLHNLTGLNTLSAFSLLSAISALVFIFFSSALVSRLTNVSFFTTGILLLLFQEAVTGGYYSNTTVIAAAFLMMALNCAAITKRTYTTIISGILLGISAWIRFDTILVVPVLALLLHRSSWTDTLRRFALILVIAVIVSTSAIYSSDSSYTAIIESFRGHIEEQYSGTQDLGVPFLGIADFKSHLSIFSMFSLSMFIVGLVQLILARKWYVLSIVLLGVIPFYTVYLGKITTPKYLYYFLPFFSIVMVSTIASIQRASRLKQQFYVVFFSLLFLVQYVLGLQATFTTKPYIPTPFPTFTKLLTLHNPVKPLKDLSLVIGAGTYITTDDGNRLSSGILYAPLTWNNAKRNLVANLGNLTHYTTELSTQPLYILVDTWHGEQMMLNFLLNDGYDCTRWKDPQGQRFTCKNNSRVVNLVVMPEITDRSIDQISAHINTLGVSRLLYIVPVSWEQHLLEQYLSSTQSWIAKKVGDFSYDLQSQP